MDDAPEVAEADVHLPPRQELLLAVHELADDDAHRTVGLGELDEEFVHESRVGDAFQLGSSTWRIRSIEHDRVVVVPAPGAPARMPFWHGEFMARSSHLTARVGEFRRRARFAVGTSIVASDTLILCSSTNMSYTYTMRSFGTMSKYCAWKSLVLPLFHFARTRSRPPTRKSMSRISGVHLVLSPPNHSSFFFASANAA